VTPFTLFNSLLAILNDKNISYSMEDMTNDVFNRKIDRTLDCDSFKNDVYYVDKEFLCRCHNSEDLIQNQISDPGSDQGLFQKLDEN
jgi:hypothetical protein